MRHYSGSRLRYLRLAATSLLALAILVIIAIQIILIVTPSNVWHSVLFQNMSDIAAVLAAVAAWLSAVTVTRTGRDDREQQHILVDRLESQQRMSAEESMHMQSILVARLERQQRMLDQQSETQATNEVVVGMNDNEKEFMEGIVERLANKDGTLDVQSVEAIGNLLRTLGLDEQARKDSLSSVRHSDEPENADQSFNGRAPAMPDPTGVPHSEG